MNQRGLIDKILARYSTELTLFRELLQNANDAKATELQIRFSGTGYWDDHEETNLARDDSIIGGVTHVKTQDGIGSSKISTGSIAGNAQELNHQQSQQRRRNRAMEDEERSFTGLRLCNNGMVFRGEDWNRIKSIADGNPDETKVGFFGVGFYSVFSLSDEPTVLSGPKALSFHWKKDALFVTHGAPPEARDDDPEEDKIMFKMVQDEGWTVFDLPVRSDPPKPKLPTPKELADFLVRCLTFTTTLELVEVYYDGRRVLSVGRESTSDVTSMRVGSQASMPQGSMFRFQDARTEPLRYAIQHYDRPAPVVVEMMRVLSNFSVHVDESFRAAMFRVTKKNPPRQVGVQLIFDTGKALQTSATAASWKDLESFSPASARGGHFFIGSGVTQQTTGSKCHCNAPFMPTMERNSMDLSDITLATWNRALLWATGFLQRITFEHLCAPDQGVAFQSRIAPPPAARSGLQNGSGEAVSATTRKRNEKLSALFASYDAEEVSQHQQQQKEMQQHHSSTQSSQGAQGEEATGATSVPRNKDTKSLQQEKRIRVLSAMATFAIKETTPVQQVGDIVLAGFYNALKETPYVWTTMGVRRATHARIKDRTGLHEIVYHAASIVDLPSEVPGQTSGSQAAKGLSSVADTLAKQARSAMGFFSSFMGSDSQQTNDSSSVKTRKSEAPIKESLAVLCKRFVKELKQRRLLRELDVRDLAAELQARPLKDNEEVIKLLRWLLTRERTLRQLREEAAADRVTCFCDWCGNQIVVTLEALRRDIQRQKEAAQSQGFFSRVTASLTGGNGNDDIQVSLECSRCQQISFVNPHEVISSLSQVQAATSLPNNKLLGMARTTEGKHLSSYSRFISNTLQKRIKASSDKGMPERLEKAFWSSRSTQQNVLPLRISQEFKDEELYGVAQWVNPLSWQDWCNVCISVARNAPRVQASQNTKAASSNTNADLGQNASADDATIGNGSASSNVSELSLENLAIASNVIRVVAFALYYNEVQGDGQAYLMSLLIGSECMPVRTRQLMKPAETYLGAEATGGFSSLPVAALCEALEDGTYVINEAVPKDQAVVRLMKQLHVKQHVDLAFVFEEFNKGSLGWNRQEILHYIAGLRHKLDQNEMKRLQRMCFLPKVEVRDGGKAYPSLQSFDASTLHFPNPEIASLGVPMVYAVVEEGLAFDSEEGKDTTKGGSATTARSFFDVTAEKMDNATQLLLKELGVHTHPSLEVVLHRAASGPDEKSRQAALWYLVKHFEIYRKDYSTRVRLAFIPCTDGKLYHPLRCFTDPQVAFLTHPCVDDNFLPAKYARLLGVRESPSSEEIMQALVRSPPEIKVASKVFEYVATLLPSMQRSHLHELSSKPIIPLQSDQGQVQYKSPRTVYFRPRSKARGRYEGLFPYVLYESDAANMFLRSVGVRDEPTVDELAALLSNSEQAERHFQREGPAAYLQVLRLLAVEWGSISATTRTKMSRAKCLIGVKSVHISTRETDSSSNVANLSGDDTMVPDDDDEVMETEGEGVTYHLATPREIYINDHAVMYRIFEPMVAPSEDIFEPMYQSLGSQTLSTAVAIRTQPTPPYAVTDATRKLEEKIRRRVQLFFFKRRKSDFTSDADKWMSVFHNQSKSFIYEVPHITRMLELNGVRKKISVTAFAVNARNRALLVTARCSVSDCASELCSVLLRKSTLNDNLLWSTIIQSSDQQLRDQGFPVARKVNNPPPVAVPVAQPVATETDSSSTQHGSSVASSAIAKTLQNNAENPSLPQESKSETAVKTPSPTSAASSSSPDNSSANAKTPPDSSSSPTHEASPPPAPQKRRSLRNLLGSVLPKGSSGSLGKAAAAAAAGQDLDKLKSLIPPQMQQQLQQQAQAQAHQGQSTVPQEGAQGGSSTADPLVNRAFRKQALQSGLNRCNPGGNADVIRSAASERVMAPLLDDLHEHNLVRVPIQFAGLDCYVEEGAGSPDIYQKRAVEATAFAQLLLGIAFKVFGLRSGSVCHLYYHHQGRTAAFNRGGALYFNFDVFLNQLELSGWDVHTLVGSDMQPRFVLPPEAIIDWFGVFGHELAHNHKGEHDAEFSNWMMMYLTTYVENLSSYLDQIRVAIQTQELPRALEL